MTSFEVVSSTMGVLRTIFCSGETEKSEINIKKTHHPIIKVKMGSWLVR